VHDAHVQARLLVGLRQRAAARRHLEFGHLEVIRRHADHLHVLAPAAIPGPLGIAVDRQRPAHAGEGLADLVQVLERQAVLRDPLPLGRRAAVLGRLDALEDDVVDAELVDLLQDLLLRALAEGQHGHDGSDPEHHAQRREQRPQRIPEQVARGQ